MVRFGRFRIVPTVRNRKAVFEVRLTPGNILFGVFPTKGAAASEAIKLDRAEKATTKAIVLARKTGKAGLAVGVTAGKRILSFLQSTDEFKSLVGKKRRRKKRTKKRRKR